MKKTWLLLLVGSALLVQLARADDDEGGVDHQYQLSAALDGTLSKRLGWNLAQYLYFDRNRKLYSISPQAGLTWSAARWLSLNASYLLVWVDQGDSVWIRHRLMTSATARLPVNKWRLSYRLRWQGDRRDPGDGGRRFRALMRNQFQLRYAGFERVAPYFAVEVFNPLDAGRKTSGVDRTRYTLGGELAMTHRQSVALWGRRQVYTNHDPDLYAFGLAYSLSLK